MWGPNPAFAVALTPPCSLAEATKPAAHAVGVQQRGEAKFLLGEVGLEEVGQDSVVGQVELLTGIDGVRPLAEGEQQARPIQGLEGDLGKRELATQALEAPALAGPLAPDPA